MARITNGILLTLLLSALTAPLLAQGTYTAKSCNQSDVNAVINGPTHAAVAGDQIIIPAGTCTWTNGLSIPVGITLTGSGTPNTRPDTFGSGSVNTVIIDDAGSGNALIGVAGLAYGQTFILSLLDIEPGSSSMALTSPVQIAGKCTSNGCPNVRIDNIIFGAMTHWTENGNSSNADTMIRTDNVFGVLDHNTLPTGSAVVFANMNHSAYLGVGEYGDNSWAQPDSFGGANNLFLENNSIYIGGVSATDAEFAPNGGGIGGARQVDRFNQITSNAGFGVFGLHGLDTDGRPRSGRQLEVYGNSITCTNSSCNIIAGYRGGTGLTFDNGITNTGSGFFNSFANISVYRTVYSPSPWGYCGGLNSLDPWDKNDNTVYYSGTMSTAGGSLTMTDGSKSFPSLTPSGAPYSVFDRTQGFVSQITSNTSTAITIHGPISESGWTGFNNGDSYEIIRSTICADQGGRGQGNYVSGSTPTPSSSLNEALDPIYEWNDSMSPVRMNANMEADAKTIANRDWYTDGSNGNPRVQTSPTSPFNGTSGVGWGTMANRPTTCTPYVGYWATDQGSWNQSGLGGQGELFVCTATNQWTLHYTPYTYPHPLTRGIETTTPTPPTNVEAIVK